MILIRTSYDWLILFITLSLVGGCSYTSAQMVKTNINQPAPAVSSFSHCSGYGCSTLQRMTFKDEEWQSIIAIFNDPVTTADYERHILPQAIAMMERIIGPKTGTQNDIARSWTITLVPKGQLDCIDESINTTTYLELLQHAGYIRFHTIGKIAIRGQGMDLKFLHNTATLIDNETGFEFAIDSWFRANGIDADVVSLPAWIDGWKPTAPSG